MGLVSMGYAQENARVVVNIDSDWQFIQKDGVGFEKIDAPTNGWQNIDVPHDWSIEGEYREDAPSGDRCGYLGTGIGWYRKTIEVPNAWKNKQVSIAFDGVFHNSTVWVNGEKLGFRPYGWISFSYDLSKFVNTSKTIVIAVKVDNKLQPTARWYTGCGIYAHTNLIVTDKIHIPESGVFIKTKGINKTSKISLDVEIKNNAEKAEVKLFTQLKDPAGRVVAEGSTIQTIKASQQVTYSQKLVIKDPKIWDTETPNLYTAVTQVLVNDKVLDLVATRFGIRDIKWVSKTGFWLNGKNVKLQGVCNHQDAGPLGAAVPDKILRFRVKQLKAMGCNAIRTAHNPQTPIFYDICDEEGMLVMDELYDGWKRKATNDYGAHYFDKWWKTDLVDWIKRDRNHPSVVVYSVGNETHSRVGKDLVELCHQTDPTRLVTSGGSYSSVMDITGTNGPSEYMGWIENMKLHNKSFVATENPHTWQVRGFYRSKTWYRDGKGKRVYQIDDLTKDEIFKVKAFDADKKRNRKQIFNSSYDNATVRISARGGIAKLRDIPHYSGQFRWTGYDYIGEAGYVHGGWPFKAFMGGAIDLSNFEKDLFYLYQSQWTRKPMVHILPHWTHPTMPLGTEIPVLVYTNCDKVELFQDGKSLGQKSPGTKWQEMQIKWMVPWKPGTIKAVAYRDQKVVATQIYKSATQPAKISLSIDGLPLAESGKDIVQVRVSTQDKDGTFYPYGENRTTFVLSGPATIKALGNGSPIDVESHFGTNTRNAFMGLTRAFIESTDSSEPITLTAASILGEKRQVTSNLVSIDVTQLALRGDLIKKEFNVFYTTDGSKPFPSCGTMLYTKSFTVKLGTTVRALILADGQAIAELSEYFANDQGLSWEGTTKVAPIDANSEQAEGAKFTGAKVDKKQTGFNGRGYLDFSGKGGSVDWYLENDGAKSDKTFAIRYMNKSKSAVRTELIVNGKPTAFSLKPTDRWQTISVKGVIGLGANRVIFKIESNNGLLVDQLSIK